MDRDDPVKQDKATQTSDSDLDPEVKEDLKMELKLRLKAIKDRYASYVSHIYEFIGTGLCDETSSIIIIQLL